MDPTPQDRFTALAGRASRWLARAGAAGLALMTLLTFVDVVGRELTASPIDAKVEMTELLMGLTVFLGIDLTTFLRGHIRVDIVIIHLPARWRAGFDVATYAVSILFVALICWRLVILALDKLGKGDLTQIWEIPLWPVVAVMALCSVVMFATLVIQWIQAIRVAAGLAAPADTDLPASVGAG